MISGALRELFGLVVEFFSKEEVWWMVLLLAAVGALGAFSIPSIEVWPIILEILRFLVLTWWLWAFFLLLPLAKNAVKHWRQEVFKSKLSWVLLELKIPREILKSPKAMEQVLQVFQSLRSAPGKFSEEVLEGQIVPPFSLEIASISGALHLYVRCQKKHQQIVEASMFSYYPDVEVREADDYLPLIPGSDAEMIARDWNFWGTEMVLTREAVYPIKTYDDFEHAAEGKQFDPISVLIEMLIKIRGGVVAIHFLIAPADPKWGVRWTPFVENLRKPTVVETGEGENKRSSTIPRSHRHGAVLEAIDEHLSKPAFDTLIRCLYAAPVASFDDAAAKSGILSAFNQYTASDLNGFKPNSAVAIKASVTSWPYVQARRRTSYRRERFLWNFHRRDVPPETGWGKLLHSSLLNPGFKSTRFLMTSKSLATLFHPPTAVVLTAPHIERVESRKAGPPAGLAIFGEEGEIERYV